MALLSVSSLLLKFGVVVLDTPSHPRGLLVYGCYQ